MTESVQTSEAVESRRKWKKSSIVFVAALVLIAVARLWLTWDEDIQAVWGGYDHTWFLKAAKVSYWGFEPYNHLAAFRPPAYPIWLKICMVLHVPQRQAIEALFLGSLALLVYALFKAGMPKPWVVVTFLFLVTCPAPFDQFRLTLSDAFNIPLLVLLSALLLLQFLSPKSKNIGIALGLVAGVFAVNRGEGALFAWLTLATVSGLLMLAGVLRKERLKASMWAGAKAVILPVVVMLGVVHATCAANYAAYGFYATDDLRMPGYKAMMKALTRIKPERPLSYVIITREAIEKAYEISPSFREMKEKLDARKGGMWHGESRAGVKIAPEEIRAGYTHWALRECASALGYFETPSKADAYFARIAEEINTAIDDGRAQGRVVLSSYLDPNYGDWVHRVPRSFELIWRRITGVGDGIFHEPLADEPEVNEEVKKLNDRVCRRRTHLFLDVECVVRGTVVSPLPYRELRVMSSGAIRTIATGLLKPSSKQQNAYDFELKFKNPRPTRSNVFRLEGNGSPRVQVRERFPTKPVTFELSEDTKLKLTKINISQPPTTPQYAVRMWLFEHHGHAVRWVLIAAAAVLPAIVLIRRGRIGGVWLACVIILAVLVFSRFTLFALIDACSWNGIQTRYLFPAVPALVGAAMLVLGAGYVEIRALICERRARTVER